MLSCATGREVGDGHPLKVLRLARRYHQHERSAEFPSRALRFPDTADLANVKASYVNGVLKLEVWTLTSMPSCSILLG